MDEAKPYYVRMLLAVRLDRRWTQRQLADELQVSRRTVIRWEAGLTEPDWQSMARLRVLFEERRGEAA